MKAGTQIIYVPVVARGDTSHPRCRHGFFVRANTHGAFCRFFREGSNELRTTSCSELVQTSQLVAEDHREQGIIDALLKEIKH